MDVILLCAFGIQADSQNNPDDPAITAAKKLISGINVQQMILSILALIPYGNKVSEIFPSLLTQSMNDLLHISEQIVATKKSGGSGSTRKVRIVLGILLSFPAGGILLMTGRYYWLSINKMGMLPNLLLSTSISSATVPVMVILVNKGSDYIILACFKDFQIKMIFWIIQGE